MENLTPGMFWAVFCAVAVGITTLGTAAEKVISAIKSARAPNQKQDKRLDDLEEWRREVDRKLTTDHNHLRAIDDGNRVTQRALLALLDHGIDGNNITQMQHAKEELQDHLINR